MNKKIVKIESQNHSMYFEEDKKNDDKSDKNLSFP